MSLPVLVDCVPYRTAIRPVICIRRWREASGKIVQTIPGIKMSHCRNCPTGESRELEDHGENDVEMKCPFCGETKQRLDRLPGGYKACRKCKLAGVKGPPPGEKARGPVPGVSSAEAIAKAEREISDVERFVALAEGKRNLLRKHSMEADILGRRHGEELEAANAAILLFEQENPDVRAKMSALIEGLHG